MSQSLALIVEDDPSQLEIFIQALRMADYEVQTAVDGRAAIDQLKHIVPNLILLDLHLPHVAGEKVLKYVKQDVRLANTRIVIASADGTAAAYLRKQVDIVLEKPISYHQLRLLAERLRP